MPDNSRPDNGRPDNSRPPKRSSAVPRPIGAYSASGGGASRSPKRWLPWIVLAIVVLIVAGWLISRATDHKDRPATAGVPAAEAAGYRASDRPGVLIRSGI